MNAITKILIALMLWFSTGCAAAVVDTYDLPEDTIDTVVTEAEEEAEAEAEEAVAPVLAIDPGFAEHHLPVIEAAVEEWFVSVPSLRMPVVIGTEGTVVVRYESGEAPLGTSGYPIGGRVAEDKIVRIWSDWMKNETLRVVALHELGHRFGANHLESPTDDRSIMQERLSGWPSSKCITLEDITAVGREGKSSC